MVVAKKYPLPEGVEDVVLNREQLADALRVSAPTIDAYRKAGMPVIAEGSNGRSYEFQLSSCWAWVAERKEIERNEDERRKNAVRQMTLALIGSESDDPYSELTSKQRKDAYLAEQEFMRTARERGELMFRSHVIALMTGVLQIYRDGLGVLPDRIARECGLTHEQIERVAIACDGLLEEAANKVERELGAVDGTNDSELSSAQGEAAALRPDE
ncbi:terminase small subunit [uncultured Cohaesibacter sp.]|uniref:terminase small subunit n=1 Tax=uncultured Cohaesibacter sp. TaxID=1002546 RepID=UPI0029C65709|nr:terminase small subunit [uncultured Cohaesibacter sp.]